VPICSKSALACGSRARLDAGDHVGAVVDAQRDADLRERVQERSEHPRKDVLARSRRDRELEVTADGVGEAVDLDARSLEFRQYLLGRGEQRAAGLGQIDPAVAPLQQRRPEVRFEPLDLHRDRRL
jgi:hypothetical protein